MANERTQALQAAQNLFKVPELKNKILFTLMALAIYRFGAHIPTAGVNLQALETLAGQFQGTLFGIYDMFTGGALARATVFALGIMPYISASIIFQVLGATFPAIE
jgi:preprotein translocase subunit SecY